MEIIRNIRLQRGLSQRRLASESSLSFRGIQKLEARGSNPTLGSMKAVSGALGLPASMLSELITGFFSMDPDSVECISHMITRHGKQSWKTWLFNFADAFRKKPRRELIESPPVPRTAVEIRCLLASTVECLCSESGMEIPGWCACAGILPGPWFVSGSHNLRATALVESPAHFRKRNIFVLGSFLSRV